MRPRAPTSSHLLSRLSLVLGVCILAFGLACSRAIISICSILPMPKSSSPAFIDFLANKWYFDAAYSVLLVRPALTVAGWCKLFDNKVIDGVVDTTATVTVGVARGSGRFDKGIIDGLVNVVGDACYAGGRWLRNVQTGYLRSYVLFLVIAAVGVWVILTSLLGASPAVK